MVYVFLSQLNASVEPIYSTAPPVPDRMYDVDDELGTAEEGAVGGVAIVIDNNAQDSGSGYYAVTDDGPAPDVMVSTPHAGLPGNKYNTSRHNVTHLVVAF